MKDKLTKKEKSKDINVIIKNHRDKNKGHPHIIMDTFDNKHVSIGLTKSPKKGKNSPNYKLDKDPLGSKDTSYVRRQGTIDKKTNYINKSRTGQLTEKDYGQIKIYSNRAKDKYLKKKKK
mgnify:CR=1 FL=1|jgi:hypothetical protein